jgi:hypothetical protein
MSINAIEIKAIANGLRQFSESCTDIIPRADVIDLVQVSRQ